MSHKSFDDAPQWYWAVPLMKATSRVAGDRLVIACGQRALWERVRSEIDADRKCGWLRIGEKNGDVDLGDCMAVMIQARQSYGVKHNRIMLELAQIPVFARFLCERPHYFVDLLSNPITNTPLSREPFSMTTSERLETVARSTHVSAKMAE